MRTLLAGASSDLEQATKLARNMVTKYGMSDKVGNISIDYEDDGRSLSSETRSAVEEEVSHLLKTLCECTNSAYVLLNANVHHLSSAFQWLSMSRLP